MAGISGAIHLGEAGGEGLQQRRLRVGGGLDQGCAGHLLDRDLGAAVFGDPGQCLAVDHGLARRDVGVERDAQPKRRESLGEIGAGQGDELGRPHDEGGDESGEAGLGVERQRHLAGLEREGFGLGSGLLPALVHGNDQALGGEALVEAQPAGLRTLLHAGRGDRVPEPVEPGFFPVFGQSMLPPHTAAGRRPA